MMLRVCAEDWTRCYLGTLPRPRSLDQGTYSITLAHQSLPGPRAALPLSVQNAQLCVLLAAENSSQRPVQMGGYARAGSTSGGSGASRARRIARGVTAGSAPLPVSYASYGKGAAC